MAEVEGEVVVVEVRRVPVGQISGKRACRGAPRVHVFHRKGHSRGAVQLPDALNESLAVATLPTERRMHHNDVGSDTFGRLGGTPQLFPRIATPGPLSDQ